MQGLVITEARNPDDLVRVPKNQVLRGPDLLRVLPLGTKLFDAVSSSDSRSSELSGPFSDVVYTKEVESKRKAKQLYGKDLYTAFSFSSEFRSAMEELKREIIKHNPDYLKTETIIHETECESSRDCGGDCEPSSVVYECVRIPGIDYEVEKEENEDEDVEDKNREKESEKDKSRMRVNIWTDDDETVDAMSGYWRLLTVFDKFRISPPWYDAYAEGQQHWLQTKPVPSDVLENSRRKCLDWLNKYFHN